SRRQLGPLATAAKPCFSRTSDQRRSDFSRACAFRKPSKTFDQLLELLTKYFKPQHTSYASAHVFHARKQRANEPVVEFVADLRYLVSKCEYDNAMLDRQLTEQLAEGLHNDVHRRKLIERLDAMAAVNRTF